MNTVELKIAPDMNPFVLNPYGQDLCSRPFFYFKPPKNPHARATPSLIEPPLLTKLALKMLPPRPSSRRKNGPRAFNCRRLVLRALPAPLALYFSPFLLTRAGGHATKCARATHQAERRPSLRRNQRRFIGQIGSTPSARGDLRSLSPGAGEQSFPTLFPRKYLTRRARINLVHKKCPLH